jgi:hypothetical protein
MLRTETVEKTTFELLKTLMQDEKLKDFNLVGGTALALYIGHRKSIDLDLFTHQPFDATVIEKHLASTYNFKNQYEEQKSKIILFGYIKEVKVDLVWDDSSQAKPLYVNDNIRICSLHDIAAMKLKAILQNGTRLKDYVDLAFLSVKIPLNEMLEVFDIKYPSTSKVLAAKALRYFNDIDFSSENEIELIKGKYKWEKIENRLIEMLKHSNKRFTNYPIATEKKRDFGICF